LGYYARSRAIRGGLDQAGSDMTLEITKAARRIGIATMALGATLVLCSSAYAQAPVALVEDVRGKLSVEFMDYVSPGTTIRLGPRDTIVLGYLYSCWLESISGGTVVVGREQSEVQGGNVTRSKTMCNGGRIDLTAKQANQSAGATFRAPDDDPLVIYGLSPLVEATGRAALLVVRLDQPTEHFTAVLTRKRNSQVSYYDFSSANIALKAGKTYRASIGARQIVFKVDPSAKSGRVPVISRLVRFSPAS
jgi:hypothetical protein